MTVGELASAKLTRTLWATQICRWLIGTAFLFAAFSEFPEHKWSIGLGVLVLEFGLVAIMDQAAALRVGEINLADQAERKTRHTIIAAAEWGSDDPMKSAAFWQEVDDAVANERVDEEKPGWLAVTGLMIGGIVYRLAATLGGIALVAALTS